MSVEEICAAIAQKLLQGSMVHQQLVNYYAFLALDGYRKCHEYHYYEQSCSYIEFVKYYINHYGRLIPKHSFESLTSPNLIPDNWYEYRREDMDINTKRNAIKNGFEKWVLWERGVKTFLQEMYTELINNNQIALAIKVKQHIKDVDQELEKAELKYLQIKASDYDMPMIISEQEQLKKEYKQKIESKKTEKGEHEYAQFTRN